MSDKTIIDARTHPDLPLTVRKTLDTIGDEHILQLQLGRTPVTEAVWKIGNFLSKHKFSETVLELGYDELWHNYLLITIASKAEYNAITQLVHNPAAVGPRLVYCLEKGPRVLLQLAVPEQFFRVYNIPLNSDRLTVNNLLTTAINHDKNFFTFDATSTNTCQTFVENLLDANNLTQNIADEDILLALKPQNTTALVAALGSYKGISKVITDVAGNLDKLIHDKRITWTPRKPKEIINKWHLN